MNAPRPITPAPDYQRYRPRRFRQDQFCIVCVIDGLTALTLMVYVYLSVDFGERNGAG